MVDPTIVKANDIGGPSPDQRNEEAARTSGAAAAHRCDAATAVGRERPSNTEPLRRANVEAATAALLAQGRD